MAAVDRRAVIVVDVANVMGSRPDGWWRDRAGAATRLLASLAALPGRQVQGPDGEPLQVTRVVAVLEGRARAASAAPGVEVVHAPADGDGAIVDAATALVVGSATPPDGDPATPPDGEPGGAVLVVTADRGLRARLPAVADPAGPRWLLGLLDPADG
jgi:hypothetical protein